MSLIVLGFALAACTRSEPEAGDRTIVDDAAMADETNGDNWLLYGRTYSEQRFSPLTAVNSGNVANVKVDWYLDLPGARGLVSTPLVADGMLHFRCISPARRRSSKAKSS